MDNIREWFACYESNKYTGKVICKGGFTTALQADDFITLNNLDKKSTLLSACKFTPRFIKEMRIRREYAKLFSEIVVI
jgi:hypothetical protein